MYIALKRAASLRAALACLPVFAAGPALAQSAYITQATSHAPGVAVPLTSQPVQTVPISQYGLSRTGFAPTPELTIPHNGNVAYTLQIGSYNRVYQAQSGGNNFSNVGVLGGNANNVGVFQGGHDYSNVALVNMQGYTVGVLQPAGAAPLNMLIAKLPNGGLLIKR